MRKVDMRYKVLYGFLIVLIGIVFFNFYFLELARYFNTLQPFIWLGLLILALLFTIRERQRVRGRVERIQSVFIVVMLVMIFYFLSGLLTGYANTPYDNSFVGIMRNLWLLVFVDVAKLYYRATIIHFSKKRMSYYVLITVLFILVDTGIYSFINQATDSVKFFEMFFQVLLPIIIKNIIITYLLVTSGFLTAATYILPRALISIMVPVFPNYDWFLTATKEIVLAVLIYAAINYINYRKVLQVSSRKIKRHNTIPLYPVIVLILLLTGFMAGFFKYSPLGIMSNSMYPNIQRGDAVITEDISSEKMHKLQKDDIIKFIYDNNYIVHRIVEVVEDDGEIWFVTKGDNNDAPDADLVHTKQVVGVVVFRIPIIGYPSVWLSEYFTNSQANVERASD